MSVNCEWKHTADGNRMVPEHEDALYQARDAYMKLYHENKQVGSPLLYRFLLLETAGCMNAG